MSNEQKQLWWQLTKNLKEMRNDLSKGELDIYEARRQEAMRYLSQMSYAEPGARNG